MPSLASAGSVQFILPAKPLRRYLSTYYFLDTGTNCAEQEDLIYPEWATVRFALRGQATGNTVGLNSRDIPAESITGPTGRAALVRFRNIQLVGLGLLPLGWYRIVGCPADRWADRVSAVDAAPEFARLAQLRREIDGITDPEQIAALFDHIMLQSLGDPDPLEVDIDNIHHAIANPEISNVRDLAEAAGMSQQRLERLARRIFGFPPKFMLRRQRFVRTLANAMQHPDLKWSDAMDGQYFDQAHFNREFHQFMGMSPGDYLAMPRAISSASNQVRAEQVGQLLQSLQVPEPWNGQ
jgi:AraC-like DNA-binding protein